MEIILSINYPMDVEIKSLRVFSSEALTAVSESAGLVEVIVLDGGLL